MQTTPQARFVGSSLVLRTPQYSSARHVGMNLNNYAVKMSGRSTTLHVVRHSRGDTVSVTSQ